MADATLADVVKKLDQVKSAVKAGDAVTATAAAKSEEAGAEKARDDAELKSIFEAIRDKLGLKGEGKPEDEEGIIDSFSHNIVAALAGASAGIVAGLTVGFIDFYKSIFKLAGKGINKLTPKWLKNFFKAFTKEGKLYKNTMKYIDDFKLPKWLDNFFKQFTKEGKLAKKVMKVVDNFKMPKFLDDFFKAFTKEGKLAKKIMKIIDNFKMPKFKIFDTIGDFFKSTDKFKEISKAIKGVKDLLPKGGGGGTIGKMFKSLGNVFKPLKALGTTLGDAFKPLSKLLGTGAKGSGFMSSMGAFLKGGQMGKVFKAFARVGKAIAAPLAIIMGIVDGFFESKDAIGKSEGMMATMVNAVVGAIGGFIDGAIFQLLDLLKSGISWIAGFFGFTEVEKFLDSFSFSGMFNEFLDDVYKWFNQLFSDPIGALTKLVSKYFGANLAIADFIVDMIKKPIVWLLELFGWNDAAAATEKFSFSSFVMGIIDPAIAWFKELFNNPVKALTNLVSGYFGAYLDIASWLVDIIKKPIVWLLELFGWDDAAAATESFSFSGTVMKVFDTAMAWIKGLFSDPIEALTSLVSGYFGGLLSIADWLVEMIKKPIVWLLGIFGWDDAAGAVEEFSLKGFVSGIFDKVKAFFTGIFSWASEEDESDSWIVKKIKGIVTGIKEWFGSMFQFDSASGVLKTVMNIMMWIPNLFVKAVAGIASWFAGLLGFEAESEAIATAGKDFSFGDLIFKAVKAIGDYFSGMFDSIVNFDFGALAKSIMPGKLYDWIFGDASADEQKAEVQVEEAEKNRDVKKEKKSREALIDMGLYEEEWGDDAINLEKIKEQLQNAQGDQLAKLASALTSQLGSSELDSDDREQLAMMLKAREKLGIQKKAEGGMVGLSPFATGTLGSAMGLESGGLFTLTQGEMVLDNQAAQTFLQAASILSGQNLMDLQRDKQATAGSSSTVVVNNTSTNQVNSSQPMVLPAAGVNPTDGDWRPPA